jgi:uncharacterized protein (TIGR00369 family)
MYAKIQNATLFKKLFVNYLVPMNRTLGIKLKAMEENETVMTMKGRRKITNYGGSIHGGAIMALAETVHGGAVLNKIGAFENLMVTENCNLKFLKKAKGDLKVQFRLSAENEAAIKSHLNENGKCEIELVSAVTDDKGDTVAELTALYHITRLRKKSSKRN